MLTLISTKRRPCMIWLQYHMVAAYARGNNEIYFYDNTIGMVLCEGLAALTDWVGFTCQAQGEPGPTDAHNWDCMESLQLI